MLPSFYDIHYFIEAANTLNFSRAAERLGIRQSSLSQAIQRLEASLGVPLFLRSKSGVTLTKAGGLFLFRCKDLLERWHDVHGEIQKNDTEIRGNYSLACHPSIAIHILPLFLPKLYHEYPQLEIQLRLEPSRMATDAVICFNADFGIVVDPARHPDLVLKQLSEHDYHFWMKQDSATRKRFEAGELPLICIPDVAATDELSAKLRKLKVEFRRQIHVPNLEIIASLVAAGTGVGVLPGWVGDIMKQKVPIDRIEGFPSGRNSLYLVYRKDMMKTQAARKIIEVIEKSVK